MQQAAQVLEQDLAGYDSQISELDNQLTRLRFMRAGVSAALDRIRATLDPPTTNKYKPEPAKRAPRNRRARSTGKRRDYKHEGKLRKQREQSKGETAQVEQASKNSAAATGTTSAP